MMFVKIAIFCMLWNGIGAPTPGPTLPPISANDRAVLEALYNATDGPNWMNQFNKFWDLGGDLCVQFGVTCDPSGNVIELDLRDNNLVGTLPPEIGNLPFLDKLVLYHNNISAIPPEIGSLSVTQLALGSNLLSTIPDEIWNMTSLVELDFWGNQLTGTIPPAVGRLTSLIAFSLYDNEFIGPVPSELGSMGSLLYLYLNNNKLTGLIPTELGDSFGELRLAGNNFSCPYLNYSSIPGDYATLAAQPCPPDCCDGGLNCDDSPTCPGTSCGTCSATDICTTNMCGPARQPCSFFAIEECMQVGRFKRGLLDNLYNRATAIDCCNDCDSKLKCDKWSYNPGKEHCKLYSSSAVEHSGGVNTKRTWRRGRPGSCGDPGIQWSDSAKCATQPCGDTCSVTCSEDSSTVDVQCVEDDRYDCWPDCLTMCPPCFGSSMMVRVLAKDGNVTISKRVDEIELKDEVLSFSEYGELTFQPVYLRRHYHDQISDQISPLLDIQYEGGNIVLTPEHLIYVTKTFDTNDQCITKDGVEVCPIMSQFVKQGDTIWVLDEFSTTLVPTTVKAIATQNTKARNFLMLSGNVIVNGVAASSHVGHFAYEEAIHTPIKVLYRISPELATSEFVENIWLWSPIYEFRQELKRVEIYNLPYGYLVPLAVYFIMLGGVTVLAWKVSWVFIVFFGGKKLKQE